MKFLFQAMHILVVGLNKNLIPLDVDASCTIKKVKQLIEDKEGIPVRSQLLHYGENVSENYDRVKTKFWTGYRKREECPRKRQLLTDNLTLSDYCVMEGDSLQLVLDLYGHIEINARMDCGKILALKVETSDTVMSVKAVINDIENIPVSALGLTLKGKLLQDEHKLSK